MLEYGILSRMFRTIEVQRSSCLKILEKYEFNQFGTRSAETLNNPIEGGQIK